jgi:hypothetical protein
MDGRADLDRIYFHTSLNDISTTFPDLIRYSWLVGDYW